MPAAIEPPRMRSGRTPSAMLISADIGRTIIVRTRPIMRTFLARFAFLLLFPIIASGQAVPCESLDGTMRECRVGSSGVIHLTYELSDNRCIEGVTWGTRMAGVVYVTRGCRAMFVTDDSLARGAHTDNRVVCESVTGAYTV